MRDLISGFKYALQGVALLGKPRVRLFVIIPLFINTLLFAGAIYFGASMLSNFIDSALTGWWEWLRWLLWPIFIVISLTIAFFCFSIIGNLVASPFNGFLAEAVEIHLTGRQPDETSGLAQLPGEIRKALVSEARKFLYFAIRALPLILLFFIPLANFAAPFLWILFGAWMLALEYMDFPMGNHGILFPELRNSLKSKRPLAFGFGLGVMLMTLIPVFNFMAIPVAVCGATRMWVERIRVDE
ncbi:MAG TPA: sulfate transporter CysZ [Gammaproteobacteria bacterium]|nr:sulfate transporter CysZ [Gammaproteobacteria bacterium]